MKRIISIALVALMVAALLVGCAGSGPAGKYVVKTIDGKSVQEALEDSAKQSGMDLDELLKQAGIDNVEEIITMELKDDGTAIMDVKMMSTKMEGTWKQDGDKIAITMEGETANFTLKGNELSNDEGEPKYVLVKK